MSAGPRCWLDHRVINPGQEADKRVEWWTGADGVTRIFSDALTDADGKLSAAHGRLEKAAHSKCYWAERKRLEHIEVLPQAPPDALAKPREGVPARDGRGRASGGATAAGG